MEVECPRARGLQPQLLPKADEHPQAYQPATQRRAPRAQLPPHCNTYDIEARSPVEVKWTNPRNEEKKRKKKKEKRKNQDEGGDHKPRKWREGGEPRETLRY